MPVKDSWNRGDGDVAAAVPVVTQDDDYVDVDGLQVIRV